MESIYFYLDPQKGFRILKLQSKQVAEILPQNHAENILTRYEIVIVLNIM